MSRLFLLFLFIIVGCASHPTPGTRLLSVDDSEEESIFLQELEVDGVAHWLVYLPAETMEAPGPGDKMEEYLIAGTDQSYLRPKSEFVVK